MYAQREKCAVAASALLFASVAIAPRAARADDVYAPFPGYYTDYYSGREPAYALVVGADIEGVVPTTFPRFGNGNEFAGGAGFKLRVGEQMRLRGGLCVTPELGYGYDNLFATDDVGDSISWEMHRLSGGARLSFGTFVEPVIYAHVGYGWRRVAGALPVSGEGALALDLGGALDVRVLPEVRFGAHIEYATIEVQQYAPQWLALGWHADLVF
jgi:hypothetical protein